METMRKTNCSENYPTENPRKTFYEGPRLVVILIQYRLEPACYLNGYRAIYMPRAAVVWSRILWF